MENFDGKLKRQIEQKEKIGEFDDLAIFTTTFYKDDECLQGCNLL